MVFIYESELSNVLNRHAPIKKRVVTVQPDAPWYTDDIKCEKRKRRKLERIWRATRLQNDRERFVRQCSDVKDLLSLSRSKYYQDLITENRSDTRKLFSIFAKRLSRKSEPKYPIPVTSGSLAQDFLLYFSDKIMRIRADLDGTTSASSDRFLNGMLPVTVN